MTSSFQLLPNTFYYGMKYLVKKQAIRVWTNRSIGQKVPMWFHSEKLLLLFTNTQ